jgi:hypothetical protein
VAGDTLTVSHKGIIKDKSHVYCDHILITNIPNITKSRQPATPSEGCTSLSIPLNFSCITELYPFSVKTYAAFPMIL